MSTSPSPNPERIAYRQGALHCDDAPVAALAEAYGTPLYVYSANALADGYRALRAAFAALDPLVCFSVKSCQNVAILRLLNDLGSGFDVVSGGELYRARLAGAPPERIVFAGVGKSQAEIEEAARAEVRLLNVESPTELEVIDAAGRAGGRAIDAALRVNPDVDAQTHEYTTTGRKETKFGVDYESAAAVFDSARGMRGVRLRGLHVHIGSPVGDPAAYGRAVERVVALREALRAGGHAVDTLDLGGGFASAYDARPVPTFADYAAEATRHLDGVDAAVILEPGRSIAANAGVLLTRVLYLKQSGQRCFAIVDASMNDLVRPALYGAYHFVWPVEPRGAAPPAPRTPAQADDLVACDVVGPLCESGDFLARGRPLPPLRRGDLLAVFSAGAYGMTMSSQYNSRPRAAEVLVRGAAHELIRRRERYEDLVAAELFGEAGGRGTPAGPDTDR